MTSPASIPEAFFHLAPYAVQNETGAERLYQEKPHPYRTAFQRDRDRIIHSKAFRRLGYKTQVFVNSEGDIYRTRLTHSLEVAQIARSVSFALRLNQDFAEALALAHDLGHTPFAHAGQNVLHELMGEHGGFEHNCQGLRQITQLEWRYLAFPGLNLTRSTLVGIMKHARVYECDHELLPLVQQRAAHPPALEAHLVDLCDRIAYVHHDLEDGLDSCLVKWEELEELSWWSEAWNAVKEENVENFSQARKAICIRSVIRYMLGACISNLIQTSLKHLKEQEGAWPPSPWPPTPSSEAPVTDFALNPQQIEKDKNAASAWMKNYPIRLGNAFQSRLDEVQKFLYARLYRHPRVLQMSQDAAQVIENLFTYFSKYPQKMPEHYSLRISEEGLHRTVADYIAGMTDRFAQKEAQKVGGARS